MPLQPSQQQRTLGANGLASGVRHARFEVRLLPRNDDHFFQPSGPGHGGVIIVLVLTKIDENRLKNFLHARGGGVVHWVGETECMRDPALLVV